MIAIHIIKTYFFNTLYTSLFLILLSTQLTTLAQSRSPIDTVYTAKDTLVLFNDKSWEFIRMINFDGVTNPVLSSICQARGWAEDWNTEIPHTAAADLASLPDTLWLCTIDDSHLEFCMPHPGMVTSTFKYRGKRFHYGIDVDCITGDSLKAAFNGIVRYAKYNESGYGNLVIIRHYNGLETYYAHLSKTFVVANQEVKAGEVIGLGGNTGRSTGDHLHFEVRLLGNALNPEEIIDFKNSVLIEENLLVHKDLFLYGAKKSNPTATKPPSDSEDEKTSSEPKKTTSTSSYHTVKSGDTLYEIALKNKTTVKKICELNGIKETKILKIGEKIKVK
jgi:LysM repeat protein